MAEEAVSSAIGPKKKLTKPQAVTVMVVGALMILVPWFFFPVEQGSAAQIVKTLTGVVGFAILCAGAYFRP
jgi:hypothetical protein